MNVVGEGGGLVVRSAINASNYTCYVSLGGSLVCWLVGWTTTTNGRMDGACGGRLDMASRTVHVMYWGWMTRIGMCPHNIICWL